MPTTRSRITVMTSGAGVANGNAHILNNSRCLVVETHKGGERHSCDSHAPQCRVTIIKQPLLVASVPSSALLQLQYPAHQPQRLR